MFSTPSVVPPSLNFPCQTEAGRAHHEPQEPKLITPDSTIRYAVRQFVYADPVVTETVMAISAVAEQSASDETVTEAIVSAVADHRGTGITDLEPLNNAVDPDALNTLFEDEWANQGGISKRMAFTYAGCEVVISSDGSVQVSDAGQELSA